MDKAHSSKIPIKAKRTELLDKLSSDDNDLEGYDLYMGIWELSVSLGNFNHNVDESVKFITENGSTSNDSFELVLLNDFRTKFEELQDGADSEEKTLHEARSDLFMRLYKELVDIEQEPLRCEYLNLCYELFDSVHPKLGDRIEGYQLIDCMVMTTCFSKGFRIQSEVLQITNRTIIPGPEDLFAKEIDSSKCLQNYTLIGSEEIPMLDLSNLSEPDYNASDKSVFIKDQSNFDFKNSINSPIENFNKISISDLGSHPQNNYLKDSPVIGNDIDVVVAVTKMAQSTEPLHEKGLDDFNSQRRRNDPLSSILNDSISEKAKEYKHLFDKVVVSDSKEVKEAVSLNVPKNDSVSTICLDEDVSSDSMKTKKICMLIIKEAVSPSPLEIKTCIPKKDDFNKEVILDGKKVKDVQDLNVSGNDTFYNSVGHKTKQNKLTMLFVCNILHSNCKALE